MTEGASRIRRLDSRRLQEMCAHDGQGRIGVDRVFTAEDFEGPWNFVDYAVLPAGCSIGNHEHGRDEELYFVIEGKGRMRLDDESFEVGPGSLVLNRSRGRHGLENTGSEPLRILVVEVGIPTGDGS